MFQHIVKARIIIKYCALILTIFCLSYLEADGQTVETNISFSAYGKGDMLWYTPEGQIQSKEPWGISVHVVGTNWSIVPKYLGANSQSFEHRVNTSLRTTNGFATLRSKHETNQFATIGDARAFSPPLPSLLAWAAFVPKSSQIEDERLAIQSGLWGEFDTFLVNYAEALITSVDKEALNSLELLVATRPYVSSVKVMPLRLLPNNSPTPDGDTIAARLSISAFQTNFSIKIPKTVSYTRYYVGRQDPKTGRFETTSNPLVQLALNFEPLVIPCNAPPDEMQVAGSLQILDRRFVDQIGHPQVRYRTTNKIFEPLDSPLVKQAVDAALKEARITRPLPSSRRAAMLSLFIIILLAPLYFYFSRKKQPK